MWGSLVAGSIIINLCLSVKKDIRITFSLKSLSLKVLDLKFSLIQLNALVWRTHALIFSYYNKISIIFQTIVFITSLML